MWTLSAFADEIDDDLETQCRVLGELGIGAIEVRSAWGVNVLDLADDQVERVRRILAGHGIVTSSIGSPIGKIAITDDFAAHLHRFDRALRVARALSAPYIRLFSFFLPAGDDPARHRDEVLRRMTALAARAEKDDVVLLHENEKEIYGDLPSRCLDLVESVGSAHLRLAWDAANFVQCGVHPYRDGYALLRPHLEYIQIKDARLGTGEVVPAGEGDGETVETLRALSTDGFDGYFSLEPHLRGTARYDGRSGAEVFGTAHAAFTGILRREGIPFT